MPVRIDVLLAVREDGSQEGLPVAVLRMVDVLGESRDVHVSEEVLLTLVGDGAVALRQLRRGQTQMPPPWISDSSMR